MTDPIIPGTEGYNEQAASMFERYERRKSALVHADIVHLFPSAPARAVDIGAGTGRDAAWLTEMGYEVTAVEPTRNMREGAQKLRPHTGVTWLNDSLPRLDKLQQTGGVFDILMLNAVWMHFTEEERRQGMANIAAVAAPQALLFMTLRHGKIPEGRRMFEVTGEETIDLAAKYGFTPIFQKRAVSLQPENKANGIEWTRLVLTR